MKRKPFKLNLKQKTFLLLNISENCAIRRELFGFRMVFRLFSLFTRYSTHTPYSHSSVTLNAPAVVRGCLSSLPLAVYSGFNCISSQG